MSKDGNRIKVAVGQKWQKWQLAKNCRAATIEFASARHVIISGGSWECHLTRTDFDKKYKRLHTHQCGHVLEDGWEYTESPRFEGIWLKDGWTTVSESIMANTTFLYRRPKQAEAKCKMCGCQFANIDALELCEQCYEPKQAEAREQTPAEAHGLEVGGLYIDAENTLIRRVDDEHTYTLMFEDTGDKVKPKAINGDIRPWEFYRLISRTDPRVIEILGEPEGEPTVATLQAQLDAVLARLAKLEAGL